MAAKFSVPEELYGPASLPRLKDDRFVRITTGKLPKCDVAFIDNPMKAFPETQGRQTMIVPPNITAQESLHWLESTSSPAYQSVRSKGIFSPRPSPG